MERILLYDGSFDGFLTAVFVVFEQKMTQARIRVLGQEQPPLFGELETICTDQEKANRVWKGLIERVSSQGKFRFYYAFLSETVGVEDTLLEAMRYVFSQKRCVDQDFSHPAMLSIAQTAKMVGREKHRMEAFVRFRLTKDGIYFGSIAPDFNILPLIKKHFSSRYADQKWMIYDIKRKYGLFYDLAKVDFISMEFPAQFDFTKSDSTFFSAQEFDFQRLWKDYFQSTNIQSRKNMKLHIRHVPKRYWKYLSEKQPDY
ncbi:MAG: TIGR03915 family putative DNA repair protein [Dokdonia sp.]|jgi:probable DNA metabolism protein